MRALEEFAAGSLKDADLIRTAEQRGYIIHKPQPAGEKVVKLDVTRIRGDRVRIGILSDTHFGSKFQQPTKLREHARYMKRVGCKAILCAGDITDGSTKMHAGFEYELWAHGADAQVEAAVAGLPKLGIPWYVIGGNHDASHWKADGVDVIRAICQARSDFTYLGPEDSRNAQHSVGYVELADVRIQLCHPHMGGTRVRSYRMERWIEELSPENKPNIVVMGNFHKPLQTDYRNVFGLMVPAYQAQSTWMASKGIASYVGGCILEFGGDSKGMAPLLSVSWLIERVPLAKDYPGA